MGKKNNKENHVTLELFGTDEIMYCSIKGVACGAFMMNIPASVIKAVANSLARKTGEDIDMVKQAIIVNLIESVESARVLFSKRLGAPDGNSRVDNNGYAEYD